MKQLLPVYAVSLAFVDDDGNLSSETTKVCTSLEGAKLEVARLHRLAVKDQTEAEQEYSFDSYEDGDLGYGITCANEEDGTLWYQTVLITKLTLEV